MTTARRVPWTVDEILVAAELVVRHGWEDLRESNPEVIELSRLLRALPQHAAFVADETFRSPKSVSRKITDLYTARPGYPGHATKGGADSKRIAEAFDANPEPMSAIAREIRRAWEEASATGTDVVGTTPDIDELEGAPEGRVILAIHHRRERDPQLRQRKIQAVMRAHGSLTCEVCGFDFGATYGDVGDGYIEVHHVTPLHASGETTTRLVDLAVLCSNCHRMIHRRTPWLTPDELRERVRRVG